MLRTVPAARKLATRRQRSMLARFLFDKALEICSGCADDT
jgi:hypothetical protein